MLLGLSSNSWAQVFSPVSTPRVAGITEASYHTKSTLLSERKAILGRHISWEACFCQGQDGFSGELEFYFLKCLYQLLCLHMLSFEEESLYRGPEQTAQLPAFTK